MILESFSFGSAIEAIAFTSDTELEVRLEGGMTRRFPIPEERSVVPPAVSPPGW